MHPILIQWATPRSTSIAFEWMMRTRGDMACFHEPCGEAWYQGDEARAPRLDAGSPRNPGLDFASVLAKMQQAAQQRPVFSRDMPRFTNHLWSSEVQWYDGDDSIWHESLRNSDGLKAQPRKPVEINNLPARLQDLFYDFLTHYQHVYAYRLQCTTPGTSR